jgi:2',3'-cyclic-nucleotide 2'-phosphodiesterase (5'-nucleotidase family)
MLGALNSLHTSVACLGNHDLDFGVEQFRFLANRCEFPWLCANVLDSALGEDVPLGNCKRTFMLTSSNGIKVGVVGVVEREWMETINVLPPNLKYLSASATVAELAPKLRAEGAEMVVVVSHQREPNDNKLATKLQPGVADIVLGGHDHFYAHSIINGTHVLRSGSDFKQLSYLECRRKKDGSQGWNIDIFRRDILSAIPQDAAAVEMVNNITASLRPKLEKPIGYTVAPLDARFTTVRLKESNLGNFVCDIMRLYYNTDCCIMASGTIRGDQIYPPGILRVKDMMNCFPFEDPCVVIALKGKEIVKALENSVSTYPALEGRFPQVSNIRLVVDPSKPSGSRCVEVHIGEEPVDLEKEYTLATRDYMVRGKDGFTSLMLEGQGGSARSIVSDENGLLISMILRQYFMGLKTLGRWRKWSEQMGKHWDKVHGGMQETSSRPDGGSVEGSPVEAKRPNGGGWTEEAKKQQDRDHRASLVGRAQHIAAPAGDQRARKHRRLASNLSSDSEEDEESSAATAPSPHDPAEERRLHLMRKVMRKWWRLAGLKGNPNMVERKGEDFGVLWTKGICPVVEGRIVILGT